MKKLLPAILAILLVFSMSVQSTYAALSFKDVGSEYWAAKMIEKYTEKGIIKGYEDGTFRPDQSVTRGQAAVILARVLELDTENVKAVSYKDVTEKQGAYKAIAAVTNAGIMSGFGDKFEPNKPLTRGQMAVVLTKAFELKGDGKASFKDVPNKSAQYAAIDALFANGVTTGYGDQTFKPSEPTTRVHFIVFLSRILDGSNESTGNPEVAKLLEEVYANEYELDTYAFEGSFDIGLLMPDMGELDAETAAIFDTLKDIKMDMNGVYKKDPMQFEATISLHLKGMINQTFTMPMVMTADKMWLKFPETDLLPLPEEIKGKFIEMDLAALGAEIGQTFDFEQQMELSKEMTSILVEKLGAHFYEEVATDSVTVPAGVEAHKVIKFEITNEDIEKFLDVVINDLLPKFTEMMASPEYQAALGLTEEDAAMLEEGVDMSGFDLQAVVKEISNYLTINKFEEFIVITQDNYIGYDVMNVDLTIGVMGENFGLTMGYDLVKKDMNKPVNFQIGIPSGDQVVPYETLMEMEAQMTEQVTEEEL